MRDKRVSHNHPVNCQCLKLWVVLKSFSAVWVYSIICLLLAEMLSSESPTSKVKFD